MGRSDSCKYAQQAVKVRLKPKVFPVYGKYSKKANRFVF